MKEANAGNWKLRAMSKDLTLSDCRLGQDDVIRVAGGLFVDSVPDALGIAELDDRLPEWFSSDGDTDVPPSELCSIRDALAEQAFQYAANDADEFACDHLDMVRDKPVDGKGLHRTQRLVLALDCIAACTSAGSTLTVRA